MDNFDTIMLSQEELDFLKETFYVQAMEMTEQLTEEVLALEANGCKGESLAAVKRFFHTLKGDSSTIGLKDVADLIHRTEDLLGELENKAVEFSSGVSDLLLKVIDEISGAVKSHKSGEKRR
ncbi:MAG TPA: Hpt domain-containing protein, partial [Thermodesulfobacteriota bacterium]|nr:Hpt domain-containing protein [Thermodesulfobacteriota bacterium]